MINKIKQHTPIYRRADLLAMIYPLLMIIPNIILDFTEPICLLGRIANLIVPLALYMLAVALPRVPGKTVLILLFFILLNAFQLVILYLFGESIIAVDMFINLVTTSPGEASELLSNLTFPIILSGVLYLPLIAWAIYNQVKKIATSSRVRSALQHWGLFGLAAGIVVTILAMVTSPSYRPSHQLYPFNVLTNIVKAVNRVHDSVNYQETSKDFTYNAVDTHPTDSIGEIHVLVIGETCRVLNWELYGYERPTNPRLKARNGDFAFFNRAISQSNTTHKCVPMMLTPTTPESFDSINYFKSILTAFNEAGYETWLFSNQPKNHSYTQYFGEEAHHVSYLEGDEKFDRNLVDSAARVIASRPDRKQLIVLHTYGSHFNYRERYPSPEWSYFTPDGASAAKEKHKTELVNAYDNTIRYTDALIDDLINIVDSADVRATVTYTSDHGEDIFDDSRKRFLHASPVPTYYQIHVPLVIWTSDEYDEMCPDVEPTLKANSERYVAPSQAMFHTLLHLAGISTPWLNEAESVASEKYTEPKPLYLDDHNDPIELEKSGLKRSDIAHLRTLGILK